MLLPKRLPFLPASCRPHPASLRSTSPRFAMLSTKINPSSPPLLVSPETLEPHLSSNNRPIFLDASWHMPNSPRNADAEFTSGPRLPGAVRFNVDAIADSKYSVLARDELESKGGNILLPHMMPSGKVFSDAVGRMGINKDDWVVVYDSVGVFSSPRAAWTFSAMGHKKISVLDGGLPKWLSQNLPTEKSAPTERKPVDYSVSNSSSKDWVMSYEDISSNSQVKDPNARAVVLDARSGERFAGTAPEPRPNLSSGHIPNSLSLPFTDVLSPPSKTDPSYRTLLPPHELEAKLESILGSEGWETIKEGNVNLATTCGSGMTAAVLWLALRSLGIKAEQLKLYDESWTGYASRRDSVIVKE